MVDYCLGLGSVDKIEDPRVVKVFFFCWVDRRLFPENPSLLTRYLSSVLGAMKVRLLLCFSGK